MIAVGRWAGRGRRLTRGGLDLVVVPGLVGAAAGLGAGTFRWLVDRVTRLLVGRPESAHLWLLLVPVAAGLVYGPLLHVLVRGPRRQGVVEVMYAVDTESARLSMRETGATVLASALCIAGGGSVGRAGPLVHLGAALGSVAARVVRPSGERLVALVAGGAAGGFAAIFVAPLAAPLFALELIVRRVSVACAVSAVSAAVPAWLVARALTGRPDALDVAVPGVPAIGPAYGWFLLVGVLVGAAGAAFGRLLGLVRELCEWAWRGPRWLSPAAGGVLLGGMLLVLPQLYGVGDEAVRHAVAGGYAVWFLLVLVAAKMLATSVSFGIGGCGGLFGPMLFIGAAGGAALGELAAHGAGSAGLYGLLGIGAALASAARAPLTAVVLPAELAGTVDVLPPLVVAVVAAVVTGRLLSRDGVFTAHPGVADPEIR